VTGTTAGFFKNEAIKILMPENLRAAEKGLRVAGRGSKIAEFELSMNRAAKKAAPAARDIFTDALTRMSFDDARKILTWRRHVGHGVLQGEKFRQAHGCLEPTVESAMEETGVVTQYKHIAVSMPSLPFGRSQPFDITDYVVAKTLGDLFYMLGEEEKKIRTNPAAKVTPMLKEVFGRR